MASNRGFDAENSKSRAKLIEAAGAILSEDGHHAISARNVAARAGLKPQLVHYYFRTMDDLMIAVFRAATEEYHAQHDAALAGPFPLHAFWKLANNPFMTRRAMEFFALGNQREPIRAEILLAAEHSRDHQIAAVTRAFEERGIESGLYTPTGFAMLMAAAARALVMEQTLGISQGHAALRDMIEAFLDVIEPLAAAAAATPDALVPQARA